MINSTGVTMKTDNKQITLIRHPEDNRDYPMEFIKSTDYHFKTVDNYRQNRVELAKVYCKDINIYFAIDTDGEIVFDATKNYNGEDK